MSQWLDVAAAGEIDEGGMILVDVGGEEVAVFNIAGNYYALADVCTHDGGTLADGTVEGCEIECPRHGARFDIRTGKVTAPPAYEDVRTFPVRVVDGRILVRED
ncbi:MAG: non-heme iron oxygenase ferredoxin subunit [Gammaproteobacteria bacterium]